VRREFAVSVEVPMTVRLTASDSDEAEQEARQLLAARLHGLDSRITTDLTTLVDVNVE
jgi:hypothetical protein